MSLVEITCQRTGLVYQGQGIGGFVAVPAGKAQVEKQIGRIDLPTVAEYNLVRRKRASLVGKTRVAKQQARPPCRRVPKLVDGLCCPQAGRQVCPLFFEILSGLSGNPQVRFNLRR